MRVMKKFNFNKYKSSTITLEINTLMPERFINMLWKKNVNVRNLRKNGMTTIYMEIPLKDYGVIENIANKTGSKINIIKRKGLAFFLLKLRKRRALLIGIFIFIIIIYYLSTFIWKVEIETEKNLSPYEIRRQLIKYGIREGIAKQKLNVYRLEEELMRDNDNIMWVKARIEGSALRITATQRQAPPSVVTDDEFCDLVAKKDGEIARVYTSSGTAIVKNGDIVKKGDVLVKGEQGKEESTYQVHAKGNVIARTFYEARKKVSGKGIKRNRTGKKIEGIYIKFGSKKLYIKKPVNKFTKYDKIETNKGPIIYENYYEIKEVSYDLDKKKLANEVSMQLMNKICLGFDKNINVVDKIWDYKQDGGNIAVRVLVVAEEDIAMPKRVEVREEEEEKPSEENQS